MSLILIRLYYLVLLITIVILIYLIYKRTRKQSIEGFSDANIPRIIWTYWDHNMPEFVEKCIETWKKHNPTYDVIVVNNENLEDYLPGNNILSLRHANTTHRISDFIRINLLSVHGGTWADASIIMNDSIENIYRHHPRKPNAQFYGYYLERDTPKNGLLDLENWFMTVPPESPFMEKWKTQFMKMNEYETVEEYIQSIRDAGVSVDHLGTPTYLSMHSAAQYVMHHMTSLERDSVLCLNIAEKGPFRYYNDAGWDNQKAAQLLCDKSLDYKDDALIKLVGPIRNEIIIIIQTNITFGNKTIEYVKYFL